MKKHHKLILQQSWIVTFIHSFIHSFMINAGHKGHEEPRSSRRISPEVIGIVMRHRTLALKL
jgi:hypothetical protein